MARLHRTQILLEPAQYEDLRSRAAAERISLSSLIRRLLRQQLQPAGPQRRHRLTKLMGALSDPGFSARDHDAILYDGTPGQRSEET